MKGYTIATSLLAATVSARRLGGNFHLPGTDVAAPPSTGKATFTQLIDHNNPKLGTFEQTYWWNSQFWNGTGSPVILMTPGEVNASAYTGYLGTGTINGVIAKNIGAATVLIEHRYWGNSSPYDNLTTENLQHLTLPNSIKDLTHFAKTVQLPFLQPGQKSNAKDAPWVLIGGSYSGALTAWVEAVEPGVFWTYLASSAVVETISDFWQYFAPVQEGMPQNCSTDVSKVIDYMDNVFTHGTPQQQQELKAQFGLEDLEHNDDVMAALENGPWLWQGNGFYYTSGFFEWCDYVENAENTTNPALLPGPGGVGLEKALQGYATWFKTVELPGLCESYGYFSGEMNVECLDTYNASNPMFTDTTLSNTVDRQWNWFLCNQPFGFWQDGAPEGRPSIVSRLVTADYWIRQCALFFPPGPQGQTYGIAKGKTEARVNDYTDGWSRNYDSHSHLVFTNGQYDPWRDATVSSEFRPGGPRVSTPITPVNLVPGGFHCTDLIIENGRVNAGCAAVQASEVAQISGFVALWPGYAKNATSHWH